MNKPNIIRFTGSSDGIAKCHDCGKVWDTLKNPFDGHSCEEGKIAQIKEEGWKELMLKAFPEKDYGNPNFLNAVAFLNQQNYNENEIYD